MERKEILNTINKEYLIKSRGLNTRKLRKNKDLIEEIKKITSFLPESKDLNERIYYIQKGYKKEIKCGSPFCNNSVSFEGKKLRSFCSNNCYLSFLKMDLEERLQNKNLLEIEDYTDEEALKILNNMIGKNGFNKAIPNILGLETYDLRIAKYIYMKTKKFKHYPSITERVYIILNDIEDIPKCYCGKFLKFEKMETGYEKYCSTKCAAKKNQILREKINLERYGKKNLFQVEKYKNKSKETIYKKYGVDNVSKSPIIKKKKEQTCFKNWGVRNNLLCKSTKIKREATYKKNWGYSHPFFSSEFQEYLEYRKFLKTGKRNPMQIPEILQQAIETNKRNNGGIHNLLLPKNREKIKKGHFKRFGSWYSQSKEYKEKLPKMQEKMKHTNLFKRGVEYSSQDPEVMKKINATKQKNNSFHTSNPEKDIFNFLKLYFPSIELHKIIPSSLRNCDYYIPELDLWIELQGYPSHNYKAFDRKNKEHLKEVLFLQKLYEEKELEKEGTGWFQKNIINVWTKRDVYKRELMLSLNLNYLEIFDYKNFENIITQIYRVKNGLVLSYSIDFLKEHYLKIKNKKGNYAAKPSYNYITDYYQQDIFFKKENEIYKKNPILRRKLIENRMYFKNKPERNLTNKELLSGFKISKIHQGYSYFSPLWIKKFIEDYKIKSLYDPCGGWGHRLLGSGNLDRYIYNDIDTEVYLNNKRMTKELNIENVIFYNQDASKFSPKEYYEAVFTCPPYYNTELYSVFSSEQQYNYEEWVNVWWKNLIKFSTKNFSIPFFSYVIDKKHKEAMNEILIKSLYRIKEEIPIGIYQKNFITKTLKQNTDILVIGESITN